jgi:hypothetical protein
MRETGAWAKQRQGSLIGEGGINLACVEVVVCAKEWGRCFIRFKDGRYCRFPTKCARGWSVTQVCECDGVRGKAALPKLRDMGVRGGENVILS